MSALLAALAMPAHAQQPAADAESGASAAAAQNEGDRAKEGQAQEEKAKDAGGAQVSAIEDLDSAPMVPQDRADRRYLEGFAEPALDAELTEISDDAEAFRAEADDFNRDIDALIRRKYEERRRNTINSYERAFNEAAVIERRERLTAIEAFEAFVKRYPDDPRFTPDALFRLAELYYEKTKDDYYAALDAYQEQAAIAAQSGSQAMPPEPKQSYQKSIAIYQRLINGFPRYAHNDASYYLLGYCLEQQGEFPESRDAFNRLIARYPKSRFVPEAWIRIGEYYFDAVNEPNALQKAAQAYSKAIEFRDHPLFDKALYKLGWVYYRLDDFEHSVETFIKLLDHYQAIADKNRGDGDDAADGGDLKNEALQYMAISLSEESWGSIAKAEELFRKIGDRPWEPELWRRLGDVYGDQTKWNESIAAYRKNLEKAPLAPDAPLIHNRIVKGYETGLREFDLAYAEREKIVVAYAPGSAWYEANRGDSKVLKAAEELTEKGLYSSAIHHHRQASNYASAGNVERARKAYEVAARTYASYLARFPHSKDAYELTFYLGDCQYQSLDFEQAVRTYEKVRDFSGEKRFLAEAAFGVVLSRQRVLELKKGGPDSVPELKILTSREWPAGRQVEKKALHPLHQEFVASIDRFLELVPKHERAAQLAYKAAEIFYAYEDFDEARRRFADLVALWPDSDFATYASNMTLETFLITEDWVAVTAFTDSLTTPDAQGRVRVPPDTEAGKTLRDFGDNAMFKRAEQLMKAEEWDEAGELYEKLVARNEHYRFADKALNNAALCREKAHRFESALRLYERIYRDYPDSDIADQSLFRVAYNAENSYDFDKAVGHYRLLVDKYPNSNKREAALHNMALLLEALQRYDESAKQFVRFAQLFPQSPLAASNLYKAAVIYQKMGNCRRQNQELEDFIARYGRDKKQDALIVQAHKSIGDCWRKLGNEKRALQSYESATKEYVRRGLDAGSAAATNAAGEARFNMAETEFKKWDAIVLGGNSKALEKAFMTKLGAIKSVQQGYIDVTSFKSAEWIIAAFYRRGYVYERFANSIVESQCPADIKRAYGEMGCEEYKSSLVEKVTAQEEIAAGIYEQTVAQCLRFGLVDVVWCDRSQESLARLRTTYSVLKKTRAVIQGTAIYPAALQSLDGKDIAIRPPEPPPAPLTLTPETPEKTGESEVQTDAQTAPEKTSAEESAANASSSESGAGVNEAAPQTSAAEDENSGDSKGAAGSSEQPAAAPASDEPQSASPAVENSADAARPASDKPAQGGFRIEEDF